MQALGEGFGCGLIAPVEFVGCLQLLQLGGDPGCLRVQAGKLRHPLVKRRERVSLHLSLRLLLPQRLFQTAPAPEPVGAPHPAGRRGSPSAFIFSCNCPNRFGASFSAFTASLASVSWALNASNSLSAVSTAA